jgi:hypothetical protein
VLPKPVRLRRRRRGGQAEPAGDARQVIAKAERALGSAKDFRLEAGDGGGSGPGGGAKQVAHGPMVAAPGPLDICPELANLGW